MIGATTFDTSGLEKLVIILIVMLSEKTPRVEVSVFKVGRGRYSNHSRSADTPDIQLGPTNAIPSSDLWRPIAARTKGDYLRARINSEAASLVRASGGIDDRWEAEACRSKGDTTTAIELLRY